MSKTFGFDFEEIPRRVVEWAVTNGSNLTQPARATWVAKRTAQHLLGSSHPRFESSGVHLTLFIFILSFCRPWRSRVWQWTWARMRSRPRFRGRCGMGVGMDEIPPLTPPPVWSGKLLHQTQSPYRALHCARGQTSLSLAIQRCGILPVRDSRHTYLQRVVVLECVSIATCRYRILCAASTSVQERGIISLCSARRHEPPC